MAQRTRLPQAVCGERVARGSRGRGPLLSPREPQRTGRKTVRGPLWVTAVGGSVGLALHFARGNPQTIGCRRRGLGTPMLAPVRLSVAAKVPMPVATVT